jgi:hypothetical protein
MSEEGKKKLKDLAAAVRAKAIVSDEARHKKGLLVVELLARELTLPDGMPELKLWRDAASKFRLQRGKKNADITVEWQREIGAVAMTCEKPGEPKRMWRYILDETSDTWKRMEGEGELWSDLADSLADYMYPEGKAAK